MKLLIEFILISCLVAGIYGAAVPDGLYQDELVDDSQPAGSEVDYEVPDLVRQRRFSCDLFSFSSQWATPNHSVCAARCIATGKKGGTCQNGKCHCRGKWFGK
ncbi:defensin coprisin [Microplitis demolitor]|uniref:defensin coprisin n=1 Tax=Microplitis demolitor TaxID=69319 RepID=UPI0004CCC083|nr:defensin coprisin [Microplitis demolitor]